MSTIRLHPVVKYILSKLPPLKRRYYGEEPISLRERHESGFEYYYQFESSEEQSVGAGISIPSLSSDDASFSLNENARRLTEQNVASIKTNDFDASLDGSSTLQSKDSGFVKLGYPMGMGVALFECDFYIGYYSIEDQIPKSDYFGYDVNARNFPLVIEANFDFSVPELFGGASFARKHGRLEQLPIGSNAYALILQKLGENFSEFSQKYDRQCQMTINFLKDVGYTFNPNAHNKDTARLYHCNRALIDSLWQGTRSGLIVWKRKTLEDGRVYIGGLCNRSNGRKREILVRPVNVVRRDYQTMTPYMFQVKSGDLSHFFLPGSSLGRKLFSVFYRYSQDNQISINKRLANKYVARREKTIKGMAFQTVPLNVFNESLLFENELLFINTLRKYTLLEVIKWRQISSESILGDDYENLHDFWITRFNVGKKTFNIQLRRLFFTDVYGIGFTHFFIEIIVNDQARIFDVTSQAGMACAELHQSFLYLYSTEWLVRTPKATFF